MGKPLASRDILPAALKQREAIKAALLQHICNERVANASPMQPPFRSPAVLSKRSPRAALVSRKSSAAKRLFVSSAARPAAALK